MLGLTIVVLLAGLGFRDPWPPDEPRVALMGWETANLGHWLIPTVAGEPYTSKPPLYVWTLALLFKATDSVRATFLLPSLIAGIGILLLLTDLATRLWGRRVGLACGYLLLVTFHFTAQIKSAQTDAFLGLWMTLTLYGLFRHVVLGPNWGWWYMGCLSAGLALLTSGHGVALLLLSLPCFLAKALGWKMPVFHGGWRWAAGVLLVALPLTTWLLAVFLQAEGGDLSAFRDNLLFGTFAAYADPSARIKPPWYYLTNVILPLWLPLPLLLPWLLPRWRKGLQQKDTRLLILLGWLVLSLLFFSALPAKAGNYLFSLLPAAVLAAAPAIPELVRQPRCSLVLFCLAAVVVGALLLPLLYFITVDLETVNEVLGKYNVPQSALWIVATAVALGVVSLLFFRKHGERALLGVIASYWIVYGLAAAPLVNGLRSGRVVVDGATALLEPSDQLGLLGWREQLLLHLDRPAVHFGYRRADSMQEVYDAAAWLGAGDGRSLLLPRPVKESCFDGPGAQLVGFAHRRYWYLVSARDADSGCVARGDPGRAVLYPLAPTSGNSALAPPTSKKRA